VVQGRLQLVLLTQDLGKAHVHHAPGW
jgi:hypothetical protein